MFQYCPNCQNLIDKVDPKNAPKHETKTCKKCGTVTTFTLRYKAVCKK